MSDMQFRCVPGKIIDADMKVLTTCKKFTHKKFWEKHMLQMTFAKVLYKLNVTERITQNIQRNRICFLPPLVTGPWMGGLHF